MQAGSNRSSPRWVRSIALQRFVQRQHHPWHANELVGCPSREGNGGVGWRQNSPAGLRLACHSLLWLRGGRAGGGRLNGAVNGLTEGK